MDVQKWLLKNGFNDVVTNALLHSKNTAENAKKWVYVSDILKLFVEKECGGKCSIEDSNCTIPDVSKRSELLFAFISWYADKFEMKFTDEFKSKLIDEFKSKL